MLLLLLSLLQCRAAATHKTIYLNFNNVYLSIFLRVFAVERACQEKKEAKQTRNMREIRRRRSVPIRSRLGQTCMCKPLFGWAHWPTDGCLGLSRCKESSPKWVRVRVLDTDQTIPDDDCLCLFIGDWFECHLAWHTSWQTDDGCGCVSVGGWVFSLTQYVNLPIWQFSTSCSSH